MTKPEPKNIVIIGGGIIGCTSAYFLTRHPRYDPSVHRVTLLEASTLAGGASGKAGGLLARWAYPSALVPLSFTLHAHLAAEHDGATRWGYREVNCGSISCHVSSKSQSSKSHGGGKDGISLEKRPPKRKAVGVGCPDDLDWIDPDCLRGYDEMSKAGDTAQVHPFQFTRAMADLAGKAGVEVREKCHVTEIKRSEDGKEVRSVVFVEKGVEEEKVLEGVTDVVIASGPWTKEVYPAAPISAVRAHSVVIEPREEVAPYCLFTEIRGKGVGASPEIYARPGREVYACGEGDRTVPLPKLSSQVEVDLRQCEEIIEQVGSISEELREGRVVTRQACYLPNVDTTGGPLIGLTGVKGEVMAAGHTCWGIQNGPATGKLVSEFVFEGEAKSARIKGLDPRIVL